ncbi:MAG: molybdopterin converting factor subunit 1 [Gammaproteobacteria bacterium]|nr:molybdopterin converting factor subunit 1 [Gammaproteobacteria bacterium]
MIKIKYFARLAESLGVKSEELDYSDQITCAADIVELLIKRDGAWRQAFCKDNTILIAINQEMGEAASLVNDGDEVAFFPPVTGG